MHKSALELHFNRPKNPIPTVEVDIDSIPDTAGEFPDVLLLALAGCLKQNASFVATIYTYLVPSVNFNAPTYSAFIGVAGPDSVLKGINNYFSAVKGTQVRFSDYIDPHQSIQQHHLEDGQIWSQREAGTWYAESVNPKEHA